MQRTGYRLQIAAFVLLNRKAVTACLLAGLVMAASDASMPYSPWKPLLTSEVVFKLSEFCNIVDQAGLEWPGSCLTALPRRLGQSCRICVSLPTNPHSRWPRLGWTCGGGTKAQMATRTACRF